MNQAAAGGALLLLWRYASRIHRLIPVQVPKPWIDYITRWNLLSPLVFVASIPLTAVSTLVAELSWFLVFASQFVYRPGRGRPRGAPPRPPKPS